MSIKGAVVVSPPTMAQDPRLVSTEVVEWPTDPIWMARYDELVHSKPLFAEIEGLLGSQDHHFDELVQRLKDEHHFHIPWDDDLWRQQTTLRLIVLQRLGRVMRWGDVCQLVPGKGRSNESQKLQSKVDLEGPVTMVEEMKLKLDRFEIKLRRYIERRLRQAYGDSWWEKGIPDPSKENAARNRAHVPPEEKGPDSKAMQFLGWGDYRVIVTSDRNWPKVFLPDFRDKGPPLVFLKELGDARNALTHGRDADPDTVKAVPFLINRLNSLIGG